MDYPLNGYSKNWRVHCSILSCFMITVMLLAMLIKSQIQTNTMYLSFGMLAIFVLCMILYSYVLEIYYTYNEQENSIIDWSNYDNTIFQIESTAQLEGVSALEEQPPSYSKIYPNRGSGITILDILPPPPYNSTVKDNEFHPLPWTFVNSDQRDATITNQQSSILLSCKSAYIPPVIDLESAEKNTDKLQYR